MASDIIFYVLAFFAVYAQVFYLVTFLENRQSMSPRATEAKLSKYPAVTVIVPCWNEEKTVYRTIRSLFALRYPKDKLKIILVDDGSTDSTWKVISRFSKRPNVKVLRKENGGKYTALNLGLLHTETEFVGCLDADSMADSESLVRLMRYFEDDPSLMAVTPSLIVENPKSIIERAQKAEYYMNVFIKKMLGFLGAIHVTPGPLTIFRKKVFNDLGPYSKAHNAEDMEIAYRMQKNHYPIEQCLDAYVYTRTPSSVKKLYKQRLRWVYGFINNTIDYRGVLFKKSYGNFSVFTVPANILSVAASAYIFGRSIWSAWQTLSEKILEYNTIGLNLAPKVSRIDLFFLNTQSSMFIGIIITALVLVSVFLGYRMVRAKGAASLDIVYFFLIFSFIAPFWLMKAFYNTAISRKPSWR